MGKFESHLGEASKLEIDGETYYLSPLGTEYLKDVMSVATALSSSKSEADILEKIDFGVVARLIDNTLAESYPEEWEKENKKLKQWGLRNAMNIFMKILEINVSKPSDDEMSKIEMIKAKLEHDSNDRKSS